MLTRTARPATPARSRALDARAGARGDARLAGPLRTAVLVLRLSRTHARRRRGERSTAERDRRALGDPRLPLERLDAELDTLAARAKTRALKLRITGEVRDRARNGRYAFVHERGRDFAAGIWVVDPAFMLDLVHEQLREVETAPAREEAYFAGARIDDDELRDAAAEDEQRRAQARARHAEATRSNLGLGHDIRAGLIDPTDAQLHALTGRSSANCSSATTAS